MKLQDHLFARTWQSGVVLCTTAGLALAIGGLTHPASAQDRIDSITDSAAEVQRTESYGQPFERTQQDYQRGGQAYYGQDYQQRGYGQNQAFDQRGFGQQERQYRGMQQQQQAQQGRRDGSPGGLGVVLRETGGQGVQVIDVHQNSPAEEAGLQPGDRIVAIDGRNVRSVGELQSLVMQHNPGERVEVVALRNGQERVLDARLETRSEALNQQARQQGQFQDDQFTQTRQTRFQEESWGQDRQVEARLASLERQLQQLLREVRTLRNNVDNQRGDIPQAPRQAQRQGQQFQGGQQPWDTQPWEAQGRQGQFNESYDQRDAFGGGSPGSYDF